MLVLHEIVKCYGSNAVLRGVTLSAQPGRCVCVAGGNAQGKTTLLQIAAGLLRQDAGSVEHDGTLGYVPQENALMADLSAYDNLWLWYSAWGRAKKEVFAPESPEEQLGLREMARKRVGRLSGGYQKRLAIAAALAGKPDYLLLDEPFAPLDIHCRDAVVGLLRRHALTGGVVFSSHDPVAVAMLADDVLFLRDGTIADTLPLSRSANPEERGRAVLDAFYHML